MNPVTWKNMVEASRELEQCMGDGIKKIEDNEADTVLIQRRAIRTNKKLTKGTKILQEDLDFLRPCPTGAIDPREVESIIGMTTTKDLEDGEELYWEHLKN